MHQRLQSLVAAEGLAMRLLEVELILLNWKLNYLNQYFTIGAIFKKKVLSEFHTLKNFHVILFYKNLIMFNDFYQMYDKV